MYKIINQLAAEGAGVLLISSEIEELIGMCDRILVMAHGEIRATFDRAAFDREEILRAADVAWDEGGRMNARGARPVLLALQNAPLLLFVVLILLFGAMSGRFLSVANFVNILIQAAHVGVIAIGMTFVHAGRRHRPLGRRQYVSVRRRARPVS